VQDVKNGQVLMMAWMNRQALELTLYTGKIHTYSRSRGRLALKGEVRPISSTSASFGPIATATSSSSRSSRTWPPATKGTEVVSTASTKMANGRLSVKRHLIPMRSIKSSAAKFATPHHQSLTVSRTNSRRPNLM